jgi:hypothetical protein
VTAARQTTQPGGDRDSEPSKKYSFVRAPIQLNGHHHTEKVPFHPTSWPLAEHATARSTALFY